MNQNLCYGIFSFIVFVTLSIGHGLSQKIFSLVKMQSSKFELKAFSRSIRPFD